MIDLYTLNPTQIVMYSTEHCADCHRAKVFFDTNHVEYIKVNLEGNERATEFVLRLNKGYQSVPTIVFPDGSVLAEPTWDELRKKIAST